jgi:hypothetical protein
VAEHTKGPWGLGDDGLSFFGPAPGEWGIGWLYLYSRGNGGLSDEEQRANARRVVACVNCCAGLPTEALEARALDKTVGRLVIANAELAAVLEEVDGWVERMPEGMRQRVRAALAKAKGV